MNKFFKKTYKSITGAKIIDQNFENRKSKFGKSKEPKKEINIKPKLTQKDFD